LDGTDIIDGTDCELDPAVQLVHRITEKVKAEMADAAKDTLKSVASATRDAVMKKANVVVQGLMDRLAHAESQIPPPQPPGAWQLLRLPAKVSYVKVDETDS